MTFDCGELAIIQKKIDDFWRDPKLINIDMIPVDGVAKAVLTNQDIIIGEIASKSKQRTVSVEWQSKCDIEVQDCSDDCNIEGEDVTPNCEEYTADCLGETSFVMQKRAYRDKFAEFSDNFAKNIVLHKKAMIDRINYATLAFLGLNAGVNQFTNGIGTVAGAVTTIPAMHWDEKIWGYFAQVLDYNQFSGAYMLSGNNLYQQVWNARLANANMNLFEWLKPTFDMRAFNHHNSPNATLLVHKTAAAIINKAWNPIGMQNAIQQVGGQYLEWSDSLGMNLSMPLNIPGLTNQSTIGLPQLYVDVTMKEWCENNDFYVGVKMKIWGNYALNPKPCNDEITGILYFECE
jgi:hypothetical protein